MKMTKSLKMAVAGFGAVIALSIPLGAVANAEETTSTTTQGSQHKLQARVDTACGRVPAVTQRTQAALDRLQGDASTKGSIAWLQSKIDKATELNRTQIVTFLQNRLDVRTLRVAVIEKKLSNLNDLSTFCAAHGASA